MKKFEERKFSIPELKGISAKNIEEHLKLYAGYVKNANSIMEKIPEYETWAEKDPFVTYFTSELSRRFAFEFDGMRNHEYYFASLEGGAAPLSDGPLMQAIKENFGSYDAFLSRFKAVALTRGIGWTVLYHDKYSNQLLIQWIDEQHLGHLTGLSWILGIDMWEHAFVADYQPSGKKQYIEDFLSNLNWGVIEKNYTDSIE
jgi:Fe-Mn family superoxide dismutase